MTTAVDRLRRRLEPRYREGQPYLVRRARGWQLYVPSTEPDRNPAPAKGGVFMDRSIEAARRVGVVDVGPAIVAAAWPERLRVAIGVHEGDAARPEVRRVALALGRYPVTALVVLQTAHPVSLPDGTVGYDVHLVRAGKRGTLGAMLCATERFGPDAPGWGTGGVSGPGTTQLPCAGCVDAALVLYPSLLPDDRSPQSVAIRAALDTRKAS